MGALWLDIPCQPYYYSKKLELLKDGIEVKCLTREIKWFLEYFVSLFIKKEEEFFLLILLYVFLPIV